MSQFLSNILGNKKFVKHQNELLNIIIVHITITRKFDPYIDLSSIFEGWNVSMEYGFRVLNSILPKVSEAGWKVKINNNMLSLESS